MNPSAPSAIAPQPPQHSPASLARRLRLQQLLIFEKVVQAGSILAALYKAGAPDGLPGVRT